MKKRWKKYVVLLLAGVVGMSAGSTQTVFPSAAENSFEGDGQPETGSGTDGQPEADENADGERPQVEADINEVQKPKVEAQMA